MSWLLSIIPGWLWITAFAVVAGAVYWRFGWKGLVAAATFGSGLWLYQKGRKDERVEREAKEGELQDAYNDVDTRGVNPDELRRRLRDNKF